MSCVTFTSYGNFRKTYDFLKAIRNKDRFVNVLTEYGEKGRKILADNTPRRTGTTAESWSYKIDVKPRGIVLTWTNSNMASDGRTPVVVLIINGHGTKGGGYVMANDFVTPNMEPLCKEAADAVWKVVKSL